jgi:membrane peptidoglycan carboxypeptidase
VRLLLVAACLSLLLMSGGAVAAVALYDSVPHKHLNWQELLRHENSVLVDPNHHVLFQTTDKYSGSQILKPLELDSSNPKECPDGKHTHLKSFFYQLGKMRVHYLTCNGWGIPSRVADATIATEDPTFYSNPGFDPLSIARAFVQDVSSGQIQSGASTISQQLVKLFVLHNNAPTLTRKFDEIVLAYKLTQEYPKKLLLYAYLNCVPYGAQANGVQAAAETYFHHDVSKLKLWQAAMIAGLPQAPTVYDPFGRPSRSAFRQHEYPLWYTRMEEVLNFLQERGYISASAETRAEAEAVRYQFWANTSPQIKDPDFVSFLEDQLVAMTDPDSPRRIFDPYLATRLDGRSLNNGLKIITTVHPALQAAGQQDVDQQVGALTSEGLGVTDGALVSINLRKSCYGCIMALIGHSDTDTAHAEINMADTPRQPGSSFKVFNYVSAFEKGLSPASTVIDEPINIPDISSPTGYYSPTDYSLTYTGTHSIRFALDNSLNIPAVETEVWNDPQTIARTAAKFGITSFWKDNPGCCKGLYATTLGGLSGGIRLYQETQAYGAFATGGKRVYAISFSKIIDRTTGKVLWSKRKDPWLARQDSIQVAPPENTYQVSSILSDNITRETEFLAPPLDPLDIAPYTAAAKTGTTSDFKDNWTEGYTPQIVTGVWVGNANDAAMAYGVNGITGAAPIWHNFMLQAFDILHLKDLQFPVPSDMTTQAECTSWPITIETPYVSGQVLTDFDPATDSDAPTFVANSHPYCQVPLVENVDSSLYSPPVAPTAIPTKSTTTTGGPGLLPGQ